MFITVKGYLQLGLGLEDYNDPFDGQFDDHLENEIDRLIAETNRAKKKEEPNIATPNKETTEEFEDIMINVNNISTVKPKGSDSDLLCIMLYDGFSVITNEKFLPLSDKISKACLGFKVN